MADSLAILIPVLLLVLAAAGPSVLLWEGWQKVLIGLGLSTFLGFSLSMVVMVALYWLLRNTTPTSVHRVFSKLQILSAAFVAFSHGSNDGQKFMGVFALAPVYRRIESEGYGITIISITRGIP